MTREQIPTGLADERPPSTAGTRKQRSALQSGSPQPGTRVRVVGRGGAPLPGWLWRDVVLPFAFTRALLLLVGVIAQRTTPNAPGTEGLNASANPLINMWAHWDAGWHVSIALDGYDFRPGAQSNVAFFPLYPLLIRAVESLLGRADFEGALIAGIIVSNLALLLATASLVALVRLDHDAAVARRAGFYLLTFPTSFFLSAVYADSVFLALAVTAFYQARCGRWWLVGLLGALATASRPQGIILVLPLAVEYLAQRRFDPRALRPDALWLALIPVGLAAYMLFLRLRFGSGLAFVHVMQAWDRRPGQTPWTTLQEIVSVPMVLHGAGNSALDLAFTLLFLALTALAWRRLRPSYALFATLLALVMVSSGTLTSNPRYGLALFPAYILLALAGSRPWFDQLYTVFGLGLLSFFMGMFALFYWVA